MSTDLNITFKMKSVKDCLYGHIDIPELCVKFMDTPEFQRLRRIRQLGLSHFVYPSANHTRFEHSLGVMYLAGRMVEKLRINCKIKISKRTQHLIQLGGLYHDIGHFAYSHLFDHFIQKVDKNLDGIFTLKEHEHRSVYLLNQVNQRLKILTLEEQTFVENIIIGHISDKDPYLYQIVCNSECGVDVDKMDYLQRDAYFTGLPRFQPDYIIQHCGIDQNNNLSFKKKIQDDVNYLFEMRKRMFKNVYLHRTTRKIEKMYWCMFKTLDPSKFEIFWDDFSVETYLQTSENNNIKNIINNIEIRNLTHNCENCQEYELNCSVHESGSIDIVRFI